MTETLGIILVSGDHARAHAAFMLAAGAAALGRDVVVFATGAGVRALAQDWSGLIGADNDERLRARGVAGIEELRAAVQELGARLIACESGLLGEDVARATLLAAVTLDGMAGFLEATRYAQLMTL